MDAHNGQLLEELVDLALPDLPPYEFALYALLIRRSRCAGQASTRIGKRTIATALGKGTRASNGNYQHISEKLRNLADAGYIQIGDTNRLGTDYVVWGPRDVPRIQEQLRSATPADSATPDHFRDQGLRRALFERDGWRCRYCGVALSADDATLDHIIPQHTGGTGSPDNLATACLMCNAIKSGRTYEEAAPLILERVARRAVEGAV